MISLEELSKLDEAGAMDLLLAYTTDMKRHDKDMETLEKDISLWKSRVSLAESKGLVELAAGARTQVAQVEAKKADILAARQELQADVIRIREALPSIKARRRSIDPDMLKAELDMLQGLDPGSNDAAVDREFKNLEQKANQADSADPLEALKRKMGL